MAAVGALVAFAFAAAKRLLDLCRSCGGLFMLRSFRAALAAMSLVLGASMASATVDHPQTVLAYCNDHYLTGTPDTLTVHCSSATPWVSGHTDFTVDSIETGSLPSGLVAMVALYDYVDEHSYSSYDDPAYAFGYLHAGYNHVRVRVYLTEAAHPLDLVDMYQVTVDLPS